MKIAVASTDAELTESLADVIQSAGGHVGSVSDLTTAVALDPELVFAEWAAGDALPKLLAGLRKAKERENPIPIIVLTSPANIAMVPRVRAAGATDVLFLPVDQEEIQAELAELRSDTPSTAEERDLFKEICRTSLVGESPNFRKCRELIWQAARCDANVLLTGETGTGKEMAADAIHRLSRRSGQLYVAVNCAGLAENLLESELFGHVEGAFTDAGSGRVGRFEYVNEGTLLLDEIGDLTFELQTKLLRVIEQRTFQKVGTNEDVPFHGRLICATSVDLSQAVEAKIFRADLLSRINQFQIHLPPLRERPVDIPILARHFLHTHAPGRIVQLGSSAMQCLEKCGFVMNVRQLKNAIVGALARSDGRPLILPQHLPDEISRPAAASATDVTVTVPPGLAYKNARELAGQEVDRVYLPQMLAQHEGNVSRAAAEAGIDRKTFSARLTSLDGDTDEAAEDDESRSG